jgi:hypothetical protein
VQPVSEAAPRFRIAFRSQGLPPSLFPFEVHMGILATRFQPEPPPSIWESKRHTGRLHHRTDCSSITHKEGL